MCIIINFNAVGCKNLQCPIGSVCKTCDVTGLPYCEHSCTIDNGGCSKDALCTEMDAPSCNGECCSRVHTNCKLHNIQLSIATYDAAEVLLNNMYICNSKMDSYLVRKFILQD